MSFCPPRCPFRDCLSHTLGPFRYRLRGQFTRLCDGRSVRRFVCDRCRRSFSTQSFRLDYRLRRVDVWGSLFTALASKVTLRQCARNHRCTRKTVRLRLERFGRHCQALQEAVLEHARAQGGLHGIFQLDELETFEHNRLLAPLTVPVLIESESFFVIWAEVASLPARGDLRPGDRKKKEARDVLLGVRRSGSRDAVLRTFEALAPLVARRREFAVQTDRKPSYASILKECFGARAFHERRSSKEPRKYGSKLFPINHTFALMRDGLSRLVRRSWAASKEARWLALHQWIWIAYRNFVRGITNRRKRLSPAMVLGLVRRRLSPAELLAASTDDRRRGLLYQ